MPGLSQAPASAIMRKMPCGGYQATTAVAEPEVLFTAEQFATRPDPGHLEELVQGRIVAKPMLKPRHGYTCNKAGRIFGNFVEERHLGRVLNNDTGVITQRDPDTVRGADIAYYSYRRLPEGEIPDQYAEVARTGGRSAFAR